MKKVHLTLEVFHFIGWKKEPNIASLEFKVVGFEVVGFEHTHQEDLKEKSQVQELENFKKIWYAEIHTILNIKIWILMMILELNNIDFYRVDKYFKILT